MIFRRNSGSSVGDADLHGIWHVHRLPPAIAMSPADCPLCAAPTYMAPRATTPFHPQECTWKHSPKDSKSRARSSVESNANSAACHWPGNTTPDPFPESGSTTAGKLPRAPHSCLLSSYCIRSSPVSITLKVRKSCINCCRRRPLDYISRHHFPLTLVERPASRSAANSM